MRGRFRILIVDDEDNILRAISSMLRDHAMDIDTAIDNNQALNRIKQIPYDLISLDMKMPDFDGEPNPVAGINLLEKLRELDPTLPVIILTGEDEATIRTMLEAKNIKNVDVFLKNSPGAGQELYNKVDKLLNESEVSVLAVGETEPIFFKRKDIVNLRGVISKAKNDYEGQLSIIETNESILPGLLNAHWSGQAGYGKLREEPVDIIGVQDNKFIVIGSDNAVFLRDFYRNNILVHKKDLEGLEGKVVDVKEQMKRHSIQITSKGVPEYLATKKSWQAVTEDNTLLPMHTEVDVLGESGGKLRIRPHQAMILNEKGQEVAITKADLDKLIGKVIEPIDEDENGTISIISEQASDILKSGHWQAISGDEMVYIPGEIIEVFDVKDKKLIVREYIA